MDIKTEFEVGSLLRHKFDRSEGISPNVKNSFEVMEVITQTCCAGTQIFYLCRPIIILSEKYYKEKKIKYVIGHSISHNQNDCGWVRYREDEVMQASSETIDIIKGLIIERQLPDEK